MGQGSGESDFSEKSPEESVESGPPSRAEKGAELRQTEGQGLRPSGGESGNFSRTGSEPGGAL